MNHTIFVKRDVKNGNIPRGEVIAINYEDEMLVGHVSNSFGSTGFICESENETIRYVTHFLEETTLEEYLREIGLFIKPPYIVK